MNWFVYDKELRLERIKSIAQLMKYFIKDIFRKYKQICKRLLICLQLLKKSMTENFIFM